MSADDWTPAGDGRYQPETVFSPSPVVPAVISVPVKQGQEGRHYSPCPSDGTVENTSLNWRSHGEEPTVKTTLEEKMQPKGIEKCGRERKI